MTGRLAWTIALTVVVVLLTAIALVSNSGNWPLGVVGVVLVGAGIYGLRGGLCGAVPPRSFGSDREHWRCTLDRGHDGSHRYYDQRGLQP